MEKMLNARQDVEYEIWWEMKSCSTNVQHDNCNKLGALYHVVPPDFQINEDLQEVADLRQDNDWNYQLLDKKFHEDISDHINYDVYFEDNEEQWDMRWWIPTTSGKFIASSACQIVRHRENPNDEFKKIWIRFTFEKLFMR